MFVLLGCWPSKRRPNYILESWVLCVYDSSTTVVIQFCLWHICDFGVITTSMLILLLGYSHLFGHASNLFFSNLSKSSLVVISVKINNERDKLWNSGLFHWIVEHFNRVQTTFVSCWFYVFMETALLYPSLVSFVISVKVPWLLKGCQY